MAKVPVYNQEGKTVDELELNDVVFGIKPLAALVHQVYTALMANARKPWAHTKDKSEVRGGGRKPWRQKGTGRARHGSIRSPIWTGGGVTFGPRKDRNFKQKINKKMNKKAVRMSLTNKVLQEKFIVLDSIEAKEGKTKTLATLRSVLPGVGKTTLLITPDSNKMILRAIKNIPRFDSSRAADVSLVDLEHHQYIITTKQAIEELEKRLI